MKETIRVGIAGYGNLGKGVEKALAHLDDMELKGIFTRRNPDLLHPASGVPVYALSAAQEMADDLDVMIVCGGSASDLPEQTPWLAKYFNVVDSFDTHANIPQHFARVQQAAEENGHLGLISAGWDPGLFSLNRVLAESILPQGQTYTFWGKGVSQGHSDAVRRIEGVADARQYTIPVPEALEQVRAGNNPDLSTRQKHTRECFVVLEEGADAGRVEKEIKEMPNYFSDYDTTVHFIDADEMKASHAGLPHGGFVIHSGKTGDHTETIEFSLNLDSNPEFTASVLAAYARAVVRMNQEGKTGAVTVLDIPPAVLSSHSREELLAHYL